MLALLREGDSEPATLVAALRAFTELLRAPEELSGHLAQARAAVDELCAALAGAREIEWSALKRAATPKLLTSGETPDFNREGVTVWRAGAGAVAADQAADRARVRTGSVSGRARSQCGVLGRGPRGDPELHGTPDRHAGRGACTTPCAISAPARCGQPSGGVPGAAS